MPHYRENPLLGGLFILGGILLSILSYMTFMGGMVHFAWMSVVAIASLCLGLLGERDNPGYLLLSVGMFTQSLYSLSLGDLVSSFVVLTITGALYIGYIKSFFGKDSAYAFSESVADWIAYDLYLK